MIDQRSDQEQQPQASETYTQGIELLGETMMASLRFRLAADPDAQATLNRIVAGDHLNEVEKLAEQINTHVPRNEWLITAAPLYLIVGHLQKHPSEWSSFNADVEEIRREDAQPDQPTPTD